MRRVRSSPMTRLVTAAASLVVLSLAISSSRAASSVLYFDHETVAKAFATGAVLVDGAGGRNYMVHASRRDAAGQVEVHSRDTDIIYVLDGSATFVTGGTIVDAKEVAPDEIRGVSVREGETRQLTKGDVIIVPGGTPHWFKEVPTALTYYVVKVR